MGDYLYFPNNLKDIKDWNIFTIKGNSFQRKPEPELSLSFYSSLLFVIEAVFISEQITVCRIGATF